MSATLIYHPEPADNTTSVFDQKAKELAQDADIRIACPYLSLTYLQSQILNLSRTWLLLTDVEEWLASVKVADRQDVCNFIEANTASIRSIAGLHAKVLIGAQAAMVGSANFTSNGIRVLTEMAVVLDETAHHSELLSWFNSLWGMAHPIAPDQLDWIVEQLPDVDRLKPARVFPRRRRLAPLATLDKVPDLDPDRIMLEFKAQRGTSNHNATGYFLKSNQFCVIKGSKARDEPVPSFYTHKAMSEKRERLIREGVLSRHVMNSNYAYYEFTKDYVFDNPSEAACIVAGNSRNGKDAKVWKRVAPKKSPT